MPGEVAPVPDGHAAWPLEKFRRSLGKYMDGNQGKTHRLAVTVLSGALDPVTLGHLHMLRQAKCRLEHAGYTVCGSWLSPTNAKQATEKATARGAPTLSTEFRLRLAELAVRDDDLVSVATWEASDNDHSPDIPEVMHSLQCELAATLSPGTAGRDVHVFLVCGSQYRKSHAGLNNNPKQGLVIVPRRGIDTLLEKPADRLFLAEPVPGRLDNLNSARVCEALHGGDMPFVLQAMPADSARLLLEPTPADRAAFGADLQRLAVTSASAGAWPCEKLARYVTSTPPAEGKVLALLVASGSMSPVHRGHVLMLHRAKERLEEAGYTVPAAWLSPASDRQASREARATGAPVLSKAFRQRVAELSLCDDGFASAGTWEATAEREIRPREVTEALHEQVLQRFHYSLEGITVKAFYVCGSDVALGQGLQRGFQGNRQLGVVIVPREGEADDFMEQPHHMVFCTEPLEGTAAALSSTKLRTTIKAGNSSVAAQDMAIAAARFVLAPTVMEYAEMKGDFDQLGVSLPGASDLEKMHELLKATLKTWAGPSGSIGAEELSRLLRMLDPSWTSQELDSLLSQAAGATDGRVDAAGFVDWMFSSCAKPAVTA